MRLKGAEPLFFMFLILMEAEVFVMLIFRLDFGTSFIMMFVTGISFVFYYLWTAIKGLRALAGHLCMSIQLFFSPSNWEIEDAMIEAVKEYNIPDVIVEQFEQSDQFLSRFTQNVVKSKIKFPDQLKTMQEKYFYLELKKRIDPNELNELVLKKEKDKTLHDILHDKLKDVTTQITGVPLILKETKIEEKENLAKKLTKKISEIPKIKDPEEEEKKEEKPQIVIKEEKKEDEPKKEEKKEIIIPVIEKPKEEEKKEKIESKDQAINEHTIIVRPEDQKDEQTQIITSPDKTKDIPSNPEDNTPKTKEFPYDLKFAKKFGLIILIVLIGSLSTIYFVFKSPTYLSVYYFISIAVIISAIVLDLILLKETFGFTIEIEEPEPTLEKEDINISIKELYPIYPYHHFSHVKFTKEYFNFKECLIISPISFFSSFIFSTGYISFEGFPYKALTSPCVLEWVGDIEYKFPILFAKFCPGLVANDEMIGLTFNTIENSKLKTYYHMLSEARADSDVKDNKVIDLESTNDLLKEFINRNRQQKSVDSDNMGTNNFRNMQNYQLPQQGPPIPSLPQNKFQLTRGNIISIAIILGLVILVIVSFMMK